MTQAVRDPASYTDPNGYVYWQGGQVYRRIYPQRAAFVEGLLAHPTFQAMIAEGRLIGTRLETRDEQGLVLAHDTVWPRSYPQEWCAPMLRDAALTIVELAASAAQAGYQLADGHPWNVLFDRGKPVFIDVGSFVEPHPSLPWTAHAQFCRFALYPLHLHAAGLGELARGRMSDMAQGITAELALRALPAGYKLQHPLVAAKLKAYQLAVKATSAPRREAQSPQAPKVVDAALMRQVRASYFGGIRREVAGLKLEGASRWATYYASCPSMAADEEAAKRRVMERLLSELAPETVLDLGSNTGEFAVLAATQGARVVALDQDEASVSALYARVRRDGLNVLPLVMDLGNPTPATGWCAEQRPDALTRFCSDTAFMLALIHHLVFTANASLEQVARLASRAGSRRVIVEWVAPEDPMVQFLRRTATKDFSFYTPENLAAALEAEGFSVRWADAHSATRRMMVCERP